MPVSYHEDFIGYHEVVGNVNKSGNFSNFYKDAINHKGKIVGEHEVKLIRLKVIEGE